MTAFLALIPKFLPAIAAGSYLVYVAASGQTSLLLPAVAGVAAALGFNLHLNAQAASSAALHAKLDAMLPGRPRGPRS